MPSIKCPQCGLVNFSTATDCKRCQISLNDFSPLANQRSYQTPTQDFHSYQMPPPPPVFHGNQAFTVNQQKLNCITCGDVHHISLQNFKKDYVPPVAYLGLFIGLIPMAILVLILRTRYQVSVPFCAGCWKKYRRAKVLETLSSLGFLFGLIFAIVAGIAAESLSVFFLFLGVIVGLYIWGYVHTKKVSPKIKKINGKQLVIDAPIVGEVCFQK